MLENSKIDIIIRFMAKAFLSSAQIIFNAFKLVPTTYQNCKSYSYGRNNCVKDCILSKINNQLSCITVNTQLIQSCISLITLF